MQILSAIYSGGFNISFLKEIFSFEYYEPEHSKIIRTIFEALSEQDIDVGGMSIPGIPMKSHQVTFAGKYHVVANNYTNKKFHIQFGEGGENDGDFDLVHGQTLTIDPHEENCTLINQAIT